MTFESCRLATNLIGWLNLYLTALMRFCNQSISDITYSKAVYPFFITFWQMFICLLELLFIV